MVDCLTLEGTSLPLVPLQPGSQPIIDHSRGAMSECSSLKVITWNIAGLGKRLLDTNWINTITQFKILAFQETWTTNSFFLEGYRSLIVPSNVSQYGRASEGLLLLVSISLGCVALDKDTGSPLLQAVVIKFPSNMSYWCSICIIVPHKKIPICRLRLLALSLDLLCQNHIRGYLAW